MVRGVARSQGVATLGKAQDAGPGLPGAGARCGGVAMGRGHGFGAESELWEPGQGFGRDQKAAQVSWGLTEGAELGLQAQLWLLRRPQGSEMGPGHLR